MPRRRVVLGEHGAYLREFGDEDKDDSGKIDGKQPRIIVRIVR